MSGREPGGNWDSIGFEFSTDSNVRRAYLTRQRGRAGERERRGRPGSFPRLLVICRSAGGALLWCLLVALVHAFDDDLSRPFHFEHTNRNPYTKNSSSFFVHRIPFLNLNQLNS